MSKTVVLVGTLDTKAEEFAFTRSRIEVEGLRTLVIDFGVVGSPGFLPDISRDIVANTAGGDLTYLASGDHKDEAMRTMATGLAMVVRKLYDDGRLDGIVGMGGGGNTSIATAAMRTLPVGVPKLMVSTLGGGDVSAYAGTKDICFMPSIVDTAGINSISRQIYANAAGAMIGMVKANKTFVEEEKPLIAASMFGNTTPCVDRARKQLEASGVYEVLVFHANGRGGKTMESLIVDDYFAALLDITTTELADEVCGGVFSAGPDRGMAAAGAGIPTLIAPGCVDMANFWSPASIPVHLQERKLYRWNPDVTLMRTNSEENAQIGRMIAAAANASIASVAIALPLQGVSMLDSPGGKFWDPDADQACFDAIKQYLNPGIPIYELNYNINDEAFSDKCVEILLKLINGSRQTINH